MKNFILIVSFLFSFQALACDEASDFDLIANTITPSYKCEKILNSVYPWSNLNESFPVEERGIRLNRALMFADMNRKEIDDFLIQEAMPKVKDKRNELLKSRNLTRAGLGLADLSVAEFDYYEPIELDIKVYVSKFNPIDVFTYIINQEVPKTHTVTYEQVQSFLKAKKDTDYFCPGGGAPKFNNKYMRYLAWEIAQQPK